MSPSVKSIVVVTPLFVATNSKPKSVSIVEGDETKSFTSCKVLQSLWQVEVWNRLPACMTANCALIVK